VRGKDYDYIRWSFIRLPKDAIRVTKLVSLVLPVEEVVALRPWGCRLASPLPILINVDFDRLG
jgi:hypothetical protein